MGSSMLLIVARSRIMAKVLSKSNDHWTEVLKSLYYISLDL